MKTIIALAASLAISAQADTLLKIDASASITAPTTGHLKHGTAVSPGGERLGVNSQYLTRNGTPWLPVMGEFHYTRSPAASWETELRKMKAAGVTIVASYVIWNHHEAQDGRFDWRGNRNLRRFVQLAAKVGLDAVVRVGPWAHAEVRFGGVPDWVVNTVPTRGNDPQYLRFVERFYAQIGQQLKGQLWKDGGRVIGVQVENEYNLNGAGQGAAHISSLKALVLKAGLDVPLYTVTGWDGAVYPSGEVTPVFGGYPDEPWGKATVELPPKETYAFRFDSRVSGDLGAQTAAMAPGTAETDIALTPFLGAEYGAGLPAMYRRRTLVSPDDIAAMLPVQLGSGVNLLGYYMFHGGRNPVAASAADLSLEESTASGGYNDTPQISYDFQAPLGPDGQQRTVLEKLRPFHYFLQDFGARLAPMTVRKPAAVPTDATELLTPRWSVRSQGDSGFLFVNNHVRQYPMPLQKALRFEVKLPGQTLTFPQQPVDVADGAYFIWPINFDLDGTRLAYATAQPVARLDAGASGVVYVFTAAAGIPVEMAFDGGAALKTSARQRQIDGRTVVDGITPGTDAALTIVPMAAKPGARPVTVLVLTPEQTQALSIGEIAGQRRLVLTTAQTWFEGGALALRSDGDPLFRVATFPALKTSTASDGLFGVIEARQPVRQIEPVVTTIRPAQPVAAVLRGGVANGALAPAPESWRAAASWQIAVPAGAGEALLEIDFDGDIGRLFSGTQLLDDWYFNGQHWQFPVDAKKASALTLAVLPLRADAPVYMDRAHRPDFKGQPQIAALRSVRVIPIYRMKIGG